MTFKPFTQKKTAQVAVFLTLFFKCLKNTNKIKYLDIWLGKRVF